MSTKEKVQEFIQSSIARSGEDLVKLAKHFKGVHACPTVYLVPDSDVFLFDVDDTISTLYAAELTCATAPPDKRRMAGARAKKHVEMIAFALQNVLLALNEHPHIRFHRAHDGTGEVSMTAPAVAVLLQHTRCNDRRLLTELCALLLWSLLLAPHSLSRKCWKSKWNRTPASTWRTSRRTGQQWPGRSMRT